MLTCICSRGVVRVLAFGLLLAAPLVAVAYPVIPQPQFYDGSRGEPIDDALRLAKRRNAEPVPFDLKYLPRHPASWNGPRGVVAVRPCAIFDRPGGTRLAASLFLDNAILDFVKEFLGIRGMAWPALYELDMILGRVEMDIQPGDEQKQGKLNASASAFVLRTRERYDWKRRITAMPEPAVQRTHRGFEYFTTEVAPQLPLTIKGERVKTGLFVADARTLVIDTEEYIKELLEQLDDGKPIEQPVGWEKVNRGVIAVVLSNPDKKWTQYLPGAEGPRLPKGGDWEYAFLDDLDDLVVGLDVRPTTQLYLRATARDPFAGKRMAWNARKLLALADVHLTGVPGPASDLIRGLWAKGRFTRTFRGFEITADAGTDLVGPILDRHTPPMSLRPHFGLERNTLGSY